MACSKHAVQLCMSLVCCCHHAVSPQSITAARPWGPACLPAGCCGQPTPPACSLTACSSSPSWRGPPMHTMTHWQVRSMYKVGMECLPEAHTFTACPVSLPVSLPSWRLHSHPMHHAPPSTPCCAMLCCAVHAAVPAPCSQPADTADACAAAASGRQRACPQLQPAGKPLPAQVGGGCLDTSLGACTECLPARSVCCFPEQVGRLHPCPC
jgi:hypothetical protein